MPREVVVFAIYDQHIITHIILLSYYNNTLKVVAKGGRRVEGGKSLVETTGSLTQTGVSTCKRSEATSGRWVW